MAGLTERELLEKLPVSQAEFRDLAENVQRFNAELSHQQHQVLNALLLPATGAQPGESRGARAQVAMNTDVARRLFGDRASQEELQKFLRDNAGVEMAAARPAASVVSLAVSAVFSC